MTREEILSMPEGENLDRLVAQKIMGVDYSGKVPIWLLAWSPSEFMGHAWQVWDKCRERYGEDAFAESLLPALSIRSCDYSTNGTVALMVRNLTPLTICRAALLATLEE